MLREEDKNSKKSTSIKEKYRQFQNEIKSLQGKSY